MLECVMNLSMPGEGVAISLGSARAPRAHFGASPKVLVGDRTPCGAFREAPNGGGEARALPEVSAVNHRISTTPA